MGRAVIHTKITPDVLQAIGRTVVEFNLLEFALSSAINVTCSASTEVAKILTCEMSVRAKIDVCFSILRHLHSSKAKITEFDDLRKRVLKAEEDRNQLMHSSWSSDDSTIATRIKPTAKGKRGYLLTKVEMRVSEINAKADEFHKLAEDIMTFLVRPDTNWRQHDGAT